MPWVASLSAVCSVPYADGPTDFKSCTTGWAAGHWFAGAGTPSEPSKVRCRAVGGDAVSEPQSQNTPPHAAGGVAAVADSHGHRRAGSPGDVSILRQQRLSDGLSFRGIAGRRAGHRRFEFHGPQ